MYQISSTISDTVTISRNNMYKTQLYLPEEAIITSVPNSYSNKQYKKVKK